MYGNLGRGPSRPRFAPVNVGDEIDVKIEAVGEKGDGVAKVKGFVIFVSDTNTGDEVRIKVNKVLRNVAFGEVIGDAQGSVSEDASEEPRDEEPRDTESFGETEEPQEAQENTETFGEESPEEASEDTEDFGEEPQEEKREDVLPEEFDDESEEKKEE